MKLHELKPAAGAVTKPKRKGRGTGSGLGKSAGRGGDGQRSRSGGRVRVGFEGGQMPLARRIPKRGFTNIFKKQYNLINVEELNRFDENTDVTVELLKELGLVKKIEKYGLKVLGEGEISKKLNVKAAKFTKTAAEKIEGAGGKAEVI